jgi:hypothetical protein
MAFGKRAVVALTALLCLACQTLGLIKQYEYDERVELSLDGSAVVDINASIPALVALRGATLSVDPEARFDRQTFKRLYEGPGVTVREVNVFRRHGRRFVHVRLDVDDIAELPRLPPLSWSTYRLDRLGDEFRFVQKVGSPVHVDVGDVGWTGDELVAFRVHLPSRINFENSPLTVERGNIIAWEQTLRERLSGTPLQIEVRMQTESILYTTLWLFAGSFVAAMCALASILWWASRRRVVAADTVT